MSSWGKNKMAGESDFIFLFIIRVVFFFYDPSWSESNFILFLFFYSIRVGPSRSELIRPGLTVRVDPVRLLYLPKLTRWTLYENVSIDQWESLY